jgi:hypothetical protein
MGVRMKRLMDDPLVFVALIGMLATLMVAALWMMFG